MNLGSKVTSKKTGYPAIGNIIGVTTPELWCVISKTTADHYNLWYDLYPDWLSKPIVVVKFNEPQKPTRLDELKRACPDLSTYELQEMYNSMPKAQCAAYPLDDIEELE